MRTGWRTWLRTSTTTLGSAKVCCAASCGDSSATTRSVGRAQALGHGHLENRRPALRPRSGGQCGPASCRASEHQQAVVLARLCARAYRPWPGLGTHAPSRLRPAVARTQCAHPADWPRRAQVSCTVDRLGSTSTALNAQARCEVAGNAVAQRVARGQHHAGLLRSARRQSSRARR